MSVYEIPDRPGKLPREVILVRHGETEWTIDRRHTGNTDIPLTDQGRQEAEAAGRRIHHRDFELVLSSPLGRALETCRLAGMGDHVETLDDLREWDYGEYEGVTTADIRKQNPNWYLWRDGCPGGESAADVGARMDRALEHIRSATGDVAVFGHGHSLRVLAVRWLGLPPEDGRLLALSTAAINVLGEEHDLPVIWLWNDTFEP